MTNLFAVKSCVLLLLLAAVAAAANPPAEVFGLAGYGRVNGDEGSLGNGVAAGGALTVPFARHWAVDVVVNHLRSERTVGPFKLAGRSTHVSPGIQYRWGERSFYGFASFGIGLSAATEGNGHHFHGRLGLVKALSEHVAFRAEFFTVWRYVAPDVGAQAGIGYRF